MLGRDTGRVCRCTALWYDIDLTFDLAIVTLTFKSLFKLHLGNIKDWYWYLVGILDGYCRCGMSKCDLCVTFDFGSTRMFSSVIFFISH